MSGTRAGNLVAGMLDEYGGLAHDALRDWLPSGEPRRSLYDLVAEYPRRRGRMLRASLCLATARVFGGSFEDALPAAVSIELLHNALLIHDDIEDGSFERRGRPTLHRLVGTPLAINAGDLLALLSLRPLVRARERLGETLVLRMLQEFDQMAQETAEGQALDLGWRIDNAVDLAPADYLRMVLKKTCWLTTILPLRVGALVGTRDELAPHSFVRFGFFLGAAFQIQDDLLNLVGDHARYGKEVSGDLFEGKRTLLLIRLLEQTSDAERARIGVLLSGEREHRSPSDVRWLLDLLCARGCIEYAREVAHGLAGAALHEFATLSAGLPDSRDKQFLAGLPTWVLERA